MKRMLGKKGYFFLIDAFVGSAIVLMSLALILSSDAKPLSLQFDYGLAEDYTTLIMNTKIGDIGNPYIEDLRRNGIINETSLTIMEQVDMFYYNARYVCPQANLVCINRYLNYGNVLVEKVTDGMISDKYGFSYVIIDSNKNINQTIYSRPTSIGGLVNESDTVIASRKVTFLQINSTTMFGPQIVEIKVWT